MAITPDIASTLGVSTDATYYELLGVRNDASEELIAAAHKVLMKQFHPDRALDGENQRELYTRIGQTLGEAKTTLCSASDRLNYNDTLAAARPGPEPTYTQARQEPTDHLTYTEERFADPVPVERAKPTKDHYKVSVLAGAALGLTTWAVHAFEAIYRYIPLPTALQIAAEPTWSSAGMAIITFMVLAIAIGPRLWVRAQRAENPSRTLKVLIAGAVTVAVFGDVLFVYAFFGTLGYGLWKLKSST